MNRKSLFSILVISLLFISAVGIGVSSFSSPGKKATAEVQGSTSFAVVELFTSEGCSSCPPADHLLGNIIEKARQNNKPIFALAFHVDYWNYLGWKDIYGKSAYSKRQKKYARLLNTNVYTPQMIVNGQKVLVGSNRGKAEQYITHSLSSESGQSLHLTSRLVSNKHKVDVSFNAPNAKKQQILNIALVERGIVRQIKSGENGGRTLHHENVVRSFKTISANKSTTSLDIPEGVSIHHSSIIAYLQNTKTANIKAAQKVDL